MLKPISIMGFMGSGKTTLGRMLAQEWQMDFLDLDHWITQRKGLSLSEIFTNYGEQEFRQIETAALREVIQQHSNYVLSLGGGTPCFNQNMDLINQHTHSLYLRLSPAELASRLRRSPNPRPLVQNKNPEELIQYIESELVQREAFYKRAHQIIESDAIQLSDLLTFIVRS